MTAHGSVPSRHPTHYNHRNLPTTQNWFCQSSFMTPGELSSTFKNKGPLLCDVEIIRSTQIYLCAPSECGVPRPQPTSLSGPSFETQTLKYPQSPLDSLPFAHAPVFSQQHFAWCFIHPSRITLSAFQNTGKNQFPLPFLHGELQGLCFPAPFVLITSCWSRWKSQHY